VAFQKRQGGIGSGRWEPWLDGGCVVGGGSWGCRIEFRTTGGRGAGMGLPPLWTGSWL